MSKITEAQEILKKLGMPESQQNEMSALTLLALCSVKKTTQWKDAIRQSLKVTKGVMAFMKKEYGRKYAPNTRETVRRHVLHQFVQARIADYNPDKPNLPVNSPKAHYAISHEALKVIRSYNTKEWKGLLHNFKSNIGELDKLYRKQRQKLLIPLKLKTGEVLRLSPGKHNLLQSAVIRKFLPNFSPSASVLYLGDTANKDLHVDKSQLLKLGIPITEHSKLPDIVLYDQSKQWIYLIEAVTSHGPMSPKRLFELKKLFQNCSAGLIFVTAFPSFTEFKKYTSDLTWDTEVWIEEYPEHLIHFNGDKFLGPR